MRKWIMRAAAVALIAIIATCIYLFIGGDDPSPLPEPPDWVYRSLQKPSGAPAPGSERPLEEGPYSLDLQASVVRWVGKKKWPYTEYKGTLNLSDGQMTVGGGQIAGGSFMIDMTSLDITSLKGSPGQYKKMMDRLRNNFFYVNQHPTASFTIVSVTPTKSKEATHIIKGKLTIKGSTNDLEVPAVVTGSGGELRAYSVFTINRNDYGIIYGEDSFFGGMGDAAIKDDIDMVLELKALKDLGV